MTPISHSPLQGVVGQGRVPRMWHMSDANLNKRDQRDETQKNTPSGWSCKQLAGSGILAKGCGACREIC